jgi:hypothetical protein
MDSFFPRIHLLFLLLGLFTFLFFLQIWAMMRIKKMLKTVLKIYAQVTRIADGGQGAEAAGPAPKRICQNCKFRDTYLTNREEQLFLYRCRLNGQEIKLDDFCHRFEVDPIRAAT